MTLESDIKSSYRKYALTENILADFEDQNRGKQNSAEPRAALGQVGLEAFLDVDDHPIFPNPDHFLQKPLNEVTPYAEQARDIMLEKYLEGPVKDHIREALAIIDDNAVVSILYETPAITGEQAQMHQKFIELKGALNRKDVSVFVNRIKHSGVKRLMNADSKISRQGMLDNFGEYVNYYDQMFLAGFANQNKELDFQKIRNYIAQNFEAADDKTKSRIYLAVGQAIASKED